MDDAFQAQLTALWEGIRTAAIRSGFNDSALWSLGQLPSLYAQLHATSESRYSEQITRLLQGVMRELANSTKVCPADLTLAASLPDRLRLLHEQFGLPRLELEGRQSRLRRSETARDRCSLTQGQLALSLVFPGKNE